MSIWTTIKEGVSAVAGAIKLGNWFTKKRDQADQQEAGAAKQKAADQEEMLDAVGDAAKADAAMRDPDSDRARRVRERFSRDGESGERE